MTRRHRYLSWLVLLLSVFAVSIPQAEDSLPPYVDDNLANDTFIISVGKHRNVGIGFGHLALGTHDLKVVLQAPYSDSNSIGWEVRSSEVFDYLGQGLWGRDPNTISNKVHHDYLAAGKKGNDNHAVLFEGTLLLGPGPGTDIPVFQADVAFLDIDVDAEGLSGSETEDENEVSSGFLMPVTIPESSFSPEAISADSNWGELRLNLSTQTSGVLTFDINGNSVAISQVSGSQQALVPAEIVVPEGGLQQVFHIHTNTNFQNNTEIKAIFTPEGGVGSAIDIVMVVPALESNSEGLVDINVDSNNDGTIDGSDDPIEEEPPGVNVLTEGFTAANITVFAPPNITLDGYKVMVKVEEETEEEPGIEIMTLWKTTEEPFLVNEAGEAEIPVSSLSPNGRYETTIYIRGEIPGSAKIRVRLVRGDGSDTNKEDFALAVNQNFRVEIRINKVDEKDENGNVVKVDFIPKGGEEDNFVTVTAKVVATQNVATQNIVAKGKFKFTLFGVSHEKGFCLNAPLKLPKANEEDGDKWKDLQFEKIPENGFTVVEGTYKNEDSATTTENNLTTATVTVNCFDYGAYGNIKVLFTNAADGKTKEGRDPTSRGKPNSRTYHPDHSRIPFDQNKNKIADAASQDVGPGTTFKGGNDNDPVLKKSGRNGRSGDRLSRYEEYRGFMVVENKKIVHIRTDVERKDLFYRDASDSLPQDYWTTKNLRVPIHKLNKNQLNRFRNISFNRETYKYKSVVPIWNESGNQLKWFHSNVNDSVNPLTDSNVEGADIIQSPTSPRFFTFWGQRAIKQTKNKLKGKQRNPFFWGATYGGYVEKEKFLVYGAYRKHWKNPIPFTQSDCDVWTDGGNGGINAGAYLKWGISKKYRRGIKLKLPEYYPEYYRQSGWVKIEDEIIHYKKSRYKELEGGDEIWLENLTRGVAGTTPSAHVPTIQAPIFVKYFVNPDEVTKIIVAHEAGHLVSLKHDKKRYSIMYQISPGHFDFTKNKKFRHTGGARYGSTRNFRVR